MVEYKVSHQKLPTSLNKIRSISFAAGVLLLSGCESSNPVIYYHDQGPYHEIVTLQNEGHPETGTIKIKVDDLKAFADSNMVQLPSPDDGGLRSQVNLTNKSNKLNLLACIGPAKSSRATNCISGPIAIEGTPKNLRDILISWKNWMWQRSIVNGIVQPFKIQY